MTDTTIKIVLSNASRMVLNAVASETGPLTTSDLFIAGCELTKLLTAVPNIMEVGETKVDIPKAVHSVQNKPADDPQRVGIEQLAAQWRQQHSVVELPEKLLTVLRMQLLYIIENQKTGQTAVQLSLTPNCEELVRVLLTND